MKYNRILLVVTLILHSSLFTLHSQNHIDLTGSWQFQVDRENVGTEQKWYDRDLLDNIMLPGSMPEQGKGDPTSIHTRWVGSLYDSSFYFNPYMKPYRVEGQMKFPFFLTPDKHYVGAAWYRRSIYVPQSWEGQRIVLFLERPHIETTVYVNGVKAGHQTSLSVPHEFDVTEQIIPGQRNIIALRVYNGIDGVGVGQDSHSVTDRTQGDWNGVVGRMELRTTPSHVWIKRVRVFPNVEKKEVVVEVQMENRLTFVNRRPIVGISIQSYNKEQPLVEDEAWFEGACVWEGESVR